MASAGRNDGHGTALSGLVALVVWLVAASCGQRTESTAVATTAPSGAPPSATTVTSEAGSPLRRRDLPPPGVTGTFSYVIAGNGPCPHDLERSNPGVVIPQSKIEIGTQFTLCFAGFASGMDTDVEVRRPDGTVRAERVRFPWLTWYGVPGDALGRYEVKAVQGARTATGSFALAAASQPQRVNLPPQSGPPGTVFSVGFAGFPPERPIELHLCRTSSLRTCDYLTTFTVRADRQGQAIFRLSTRSDDPTGTYCLILGGIPKSSVNEADCYSSQAFTLR